MHDFWNPGPEEQRTGMAQFPKNVALLGGALAFLALATVEWPLAVGGGIARGTIRRTRDASGDSTIVKRSHA